MFPKHWHWHGMASASPRWRTFDDIQGIEERVRKARSWEDLPLEDQIFLTACIRDVERGVDGLPPKGPIEELDGFVASLEVIGVPDSFGPFWGCPTAPDTPWRWRAPQYRMIQNKTAERTRVEAELRRHQAAGWSDDEDRPHLCSCGFTYRAGELPAHQAEQIIVEAVRVELEDTVGGPA